MKKLWTALAVLLPVAYIIGRWMSPKQTIVVTPSDVHVHPPAAIPAPQPRMYARVRGSLEANRIWLDPIGIAVVSALAAWYAIDFARESNDINEAQSALIQRQIAIDASSNGINEAQSALLQRQIAVDASQILPVFSFERQLEYREDELISWIVMSNDGGLARNLALNVYYGAIIVWSQPGGRFFELEIAMNGLEHEYRVQPMETLSERSVRVESSFPLRDYEWASGWLVRGARQGLSAEGAYVNIEIYASVEYQDYQGNSRKEYYSLLRSYDHEQKSLDVYSVSDQYFMMRGEQSRSNLVLPIGISDEQVFRAHIISIVEAMMREEDALVATPVASPVALSSFGYWPLGLLEPHPHRQHIGEVERSS